MGEDHIGDYLLTWDGKVPKHVDVVNALVKQMIETSNCTKQEVYNAWIHLFEDIYTNGTKNYKCYHDSKMQSAVHILFWLTLQEDINKPEHLGRLRPFCRYAEAIATTQDGFEYTLDEVIKRINSHNPENLDKWKLP